MSYLTQISIGCLAAIDFATTRYAVQRLGPDVEANPLWRLGFVHRPLLFDFLYAAGVLAMIAISLWAESPWVSIGLISAFSIAVLNNLIALVSTLRS